MATAPRFYLPPTLPPATLERFYTGHKLLIGIVGDSISFPTFVTAPAAHVNWVTGLFRKHQWTNGLRGIWCPSGTYSSAAGYGGFTQSTNNTNIVLNDNSVGGDEDESYFGEVGLNLETMLCKPLRWPSGGTPPTNTIYIQFDLHGDLSGGQIASPVPTADSLRIIQATNLRIAVYVLRKYDEPIPDSLQADVVDQAGNTLKTISTPVSIPALGADDDPDWYPVVFDLSGMTVLSGSDVKSLRFRLRSFSPTVGVSAGDYLYVRGAMWYDNDDQEGALVVPLAGKGGWNTANLRFDQDGAGSGEEDTAEAFGRVAMAYGYGDADNLRVLVIECGQNINGNGQVSGNTTTAIFTEDVGFVAQQRIKAIRDAGGDVDLVLFLATHQWGPSGDSGEIERAVTRGNRMFDACGYNLGDYGVLAIPAWLETWPSGHYANSPTDYHLSQDGADEYGDAFWAMCEFYGNPSPSVTPWLSPSFYGKTAGSGGLSILNPNNAIDGVTDPSFATAAEFALGPSSGAETQRHFVRRSNQASAHIPPNLNYIGLDLRLVLSVPATGSPTVKIDAHGHSNQNGTPVTSVGTDAPITADGTTQIISLGGASSTLSDPTPSTNELLDPNRGFFFDFQCLGVDCDVSVNDIAYRVRFDDPTLPGSPPALPPLEGPPEELPPFPPGVNDTGWIRPNVITVFDSATGTWADKDNAKDNFSSTEASIVLAADEVAFIRGTDLSIHADLVPEAAIITGMETRVLARTASGDIVVCTQVIAFHLSGSWSDDLGPNDPDDEQGWQNYLTDERTYYQFGSPNFRWNGPDRLTRQNIFGGTAFGSQFGFKTGLMAGDTLYIASFEFRFTWELRRSAKMRRRIATDNLQRPNPAIPPEWRERQ